uniref:Uncharacterized protein n=1 Tax=viral metagenome TaxID=1070528 RepID=A0A6C0DHA4_9ZZZZ
MDILLDKFFCDFIPFQKKRVRFSNIIDCILIPCCNDLYVIKDDLWWTSIECDFFYYSSVREIKRFIKNRDPTLSFKEGKIILYQSGIYDLEDSCYI